MWSGENLIYQETKTCIMKYRADIELINGTFELIEDEPIDIDKIEELYINDKNIGKDTIENWTGRKLDIVLGNKINELVQVVKQLNKEIKSIKEKEDG